MRRAIAAWRCTGAPPWRSGLRSPKPRERRPPLPRRRPRRMNSELPWWRACGGCAVTTPPSLPIGCFSACSRAGMGERPKGPKGTAKSGLRAAPRPRAIAHFFHVPGVIVTRVPSPPPSLSPATPLDLGRLTTLEEAQRTVSFKIVVPPALGAPDAVYVASGPPGGEVALAYKPRPGIPLVGETALGVLVTEFRGDLVPQFITKEVGPGTTLEETSVNGDPGWWIAGQPHTIVIRTSPYDSQPETLRLASNTLVWEHGGVTYRIESRLAKATVIRLAVGGP